MKLRLLPGSLAARTALVLLIGLALVQVAGLTIHALDRMDIQRLAQMRDLAVRVMVTYRNVALAAPDQRDEVLREMNRAPGIVTTMGPQPVTSDMPETPPPLQRMVHANLQLVPMAQALRPHDFLMEGDPSWGRILIDARMPDGNWLNFDAKIEPPTPWHSPTFLIAFLLMTAAAALLTLWAVRRLTAPVSTLARAAEQLGRDVNAPPLPEDGPTEVAKAAAAFNTMAARIRRFVSDRTEMLTAIGHDLRTPITRLKLRAEFIDDDELRRKMLLDLEELEAMVSATLAFGRDATATEPVSAIDLAELLRTVLDEAGDARPDAADALSYAGPPHLTVRARPLALKRALANLIANAVSYGGSARVRLDGPLAGTIGVAIEDAGPGIPPQELDRVFEPFHRVESSRNRETGGVGLGLPIARNILRAHGGDVTLSNRPGGGARAIVTLPA
jgi:signal transduction histidine kinase